MKQSFIVLACLLLSLGCFCQRNIKTGHYILPASYEANCITVSMPFGKTDITGITGDTSALQKPGDFFLEVAYTDFPAGKDLTSLNKERVATFLNRFPLLKADRIATCFVRQMDGAEREEAIKMFHGIIIRLRPLQSPRTMQHDLYELDKLLETGSSLTVTGIRNNDDLKKDSILKRLKLKNGLVAASNIPAKYEQRPWDMSATGYDRMRRSPLDSSITISPKSALKKGLISKAAYKAYDWTPWVTLYFRRVGDSSFKRSTPPTIKNNETVDVVRKPVEIVHPDSTLLKVFARTGWKNFTVVEDVTVSMYPYSAQLLSWLRSHTESFTNSFVCFNDGDEMSNQEKKPGNTGGIYASTCNSFSALKKLIRETMEKGNGGDIAENDVEALLFGEITFPDNDFQVLIADNRAPVRDIMLVNKLKKPVRVILCGATPYSINADYINIARQTNGSVHLIEQDISDPASLPENFVLQPEK